MIGPEKLEFSWDSHGVKRKRLKPGASQRNSSLGKIPHSSPNSQTTLKETGAELTGPGVSDPHLAHPCLLLKRNLMQILKVDLGAPGPLCFIFPVGHIESYFSCPLHCHLSGGPKEDGAEPGL